MEYRIKVGDKIRCIDNTGYPERMTTGKLYTVLEIYKSPSSDHDGLFIDVINDVGSYSSPRINRFDYLTHHRNNIIDEILE